MWLRLVEGWTMGNRLTYLGYSAEGIALYRPVDDEYRDVILSVGNRFRCGGTWNVWRITAVDVSNATVTVVREEPSEQGPFVWNYRSACLQHVALTHAVNVFDR
jgi:hypothetical protein